VVGLVALRTQAALLSDDRQDQTQTPRAPVRLRIPEELQELSEGTFRGQQEELLCTHSQLESTPELHSQNAFRKEIELV